jgi:hypothetical protein
VANGLNVTLESRPLTWECAKRVGKPLNCWPKKMGESILELVVLGYAAEYNLELDAGRLISAMRYMDEQDQAGH